jgi:hypothetical protein
MAIQVHAHARPVQARGDLFDMGGFAGAVQALHHDPAVAGKAGKNRQRHIVIEAIGLIDFGHMLITPDKSRHLQIRVQAEHAANRYLAHFLGHGKAARFRAIGGGRIALPSCMRVVSWDHDGDLSLDCSVTGGWRPLSGPAPGQRAAGRAGTAAIFPPSCA